MSRIPENILPALQKAGVQLSREFWWSYHKDTATFDIVHLLSKYIERVEELEGEIVELKAKLET